MKDTIGTKLQKRQALDGEDGKRTSLHLRHTTAVRAEVCLPPCGQRSVSLGARSPGRQEVLIMKFYSDNSVKIKQ